MNYVVIFLFFMMVAIFVMLSSITRSRKHSLRSFLYKSLKSNLSKRISRFKHYFYLPQRSWGKAMFYTWVWFCSQGEGGVCLSARGWYASYWNAILLMSCFSKIKPNKNEIICFLWKFLRTFSLWFWLVNPNVTFYAWSVTLKKLLACTSFVINYQTVFYQS